MSILSSFTPWQIIGCAMSGLLFVSLILQHFLDARRPEGKDFERGFDAGLEHAARIIAATGDRQAECHARTIRAARRAP